MNKVINYILWAIMLLGLTVILGFVSNTQNELSGKEIIIKIDQNDENFFIEKNNIESILPFTAESFQNTNVSNIEINKIEEKINNHPAVSNAEVFSTIDGDIVIHIRQRKPIARVFNHLKESYYLDTEGYLMPPSEKFTSRVLIINGFIPESYARWSNSSIGEINKIDSLKNATILDELFILSEFIYNNAFWRAQIEQLYVNKDFEVELIPRVGSHKIVFGEINDIEKKFNKLMTFYEKGLTKTGWNEYSIINLKFDNQVVCTKRYKQ